MPGNGRKKEHELAIEYWKMDEDATVRDVLLAVRADEASHAHVNHTFSSMGTTQKNPFVKGESHLPENFVEPPRVCRRKKSSGSRYDYSV